MEANGALLLEGRTLAGGWSVGKMQERHPDMTGGNFSVTYPASRADGRKGFLKVLNLERALRSPNALDILAEQTTQFKAERDLCIYCGEKRLSRVVTAIDYGEIDIEGLGVLGRVSYIIFELGTSDIRRALSVQGGIDEVVRLHYLHSVALGLRQLHSIGVAHQDLKPSNFLVFPEEPGGRPTGKLADLGRSYRAGHPSNLDLLPRPGDLNYAPPEQLYEFAYPDERTRRYSADLFQLGSMAAFLFTGETMNSKLSRELNEAHHWQVFGDGYMEVLPYLQVAFTKSLNSDSEKLKTIGGRAALELIQFLCNPDAEERGHPVSRRRKHGSPYALDRVVSNLDLAARRAALEMS